MLISRTCHGMNVDSCKMLAITGYQAVGVNDTSHSRIVF